jgi:GRASP55/65 PDZ-like domain
VIASSSESNKGRFENSEELTEYIKDKVGKEVCLIVYNTEMRRVREVCIVPKVGWGGSGIIGC